MGQRAKILTEILGFDGWKVKDAFFESAAGKRVVPVGSLEHVVIVHDPFHIMKLAGLSALTRKRMDLNDRPVGAARGAMG